MALDFLPNGLRDKDQRKIRQQVQVTQVVEVNERREEVAGRSERVPGNRASG